MMRSIIPKLYFLFLFALVSKIFEGIFGEPRPSALSSDTVHFALSTVLMGWTLTLAYPMYQSIRRVLMSHKLLLGMYLLAAISCCWSPDPISSVRLIFLPLVLLVSSAYLSLTFNPEEMVGLIAKASALFAVGSIVGQFMLNSVQDTLLQGWSGLYGHKNYLGVGMAIGIASLFALRTRWNFSRWCMLILFLVMLLLARSASASISALSVVGIFTIKRLPRFVRLSLPVVAAVALVSLIWTSDVDNFIQWVFNLVGKDTTLTGRNDIWYFVSVQMRDRPILGYGYQGFWSPHQDIVIANLGWNPGHAHNGFLDIILTLGLIGLFLLIAVLLDGVRCGRRVRVRWGDFAGGWLLLVMWLEVLNNMTEADYMGVAPLWTLFVIAYFSCSLAASKRISVRGENVETVIFPENALLQSG
jgi:exopolysaccharide production protein ExoQ